MSVRIRVGIDRADTDEKPRVTEEESMTEKHTIAKEVVITEERSVEEWMADEVAAAELIRASWQAPERYQRGRDQRQSQDPADPRGEAN